jgi:hypothetical protein
LKVCERRQLLTTSLVALTSGYVLLSPQGAAGLVSSSIAQAAELKESASATVPNNSNRPRATLEALIPATKQRILIEKALETARQLKVAAAETKSNDGSYQNPERVDRYIQELKEILEPPHDDDDDSEFRIPTLPFQKQQQAMQNINDNCLSGRSVRASMNVYTANLRFGESYLLTASPEVRKKMIREEQLPDVKTVITADLDLRDLYRNKIQTTMEDAQAELYNRPDNLEDVVELVDLLQDASSAFTTWFGFIAPQDVQEALDAVRLL